MSCDARLDINGAQSAKGAEQAASRVWVRSVAERMARKKELEFCSNSETGTQDWNVELDRKVEKKGAHVDEVKLRPKEVSKGDGRGVVTTVTLGDMDVEITDGARLVSVSVAMVSEGVIAAGEEGGDVVAGTTFSSLSLSFRLCMGDGKGPSRRAGRSERSMRISPLASSCSNSDGDS